jgi:hypothetical protein
MMRSQTSNKVCEINLITKYKLFLYDIRQCFCGWDISLKKFRFFISFKATKWLSLNVIVFFRSINEIRLIKDNFKIDKVRSINIIHSLI